MKDAKGHGSNSQGGSDALAARIQRFVTNSGVTATERNKWMGSGQGARAPLVAAHQRGVSEATGPSKP